MLIYYLFDKNKKIKSADFKQKLQNPSGVHVEDLRIILQ